MSHRAPKEKLRRYNAKKFAHLARLGVRYWFVILLRRASDNCAAALATDGKAFPMSEFKSLPLPECDRDDCMCIIGASKTLTPERTEFIPVNAVNEARSGNHVVVKDVEPSGCYPLRDGIKPGDIVQLVKFDHGYWHVTKADGRWATIYMMNIDRILK
jgi:hypothetical protein